MATATITLTTIGTAAGPFDLYSNSDPYVVPFETGITRAQLLAGFLWNNLPTAATIVRVKSTIYCVNFLNINVTNATTTTAGPTTTTTTTTAAPTTTTTSTTTTTTTAAPTTTTTTTAP